MEKEDVRRVKFVENICPAVMASSLFSDPHGVTYAAGDHAFLRTKLICADYGNS